MDIVSPFNPNTLDRTPRTVRAADEVLQGTAGTVDIPRESFAARLNRATTSTALTPDQQRKVQVEKTAGDLVSVALILPMLKQLRRGSMNTDPVFGGGAGEKAFGPEFDMTLADRIAQSPNLPIKKALVERMLNRSKVIDKRAYYQALGKGMNLNG